MADGKTTEAENKTKRPPKGKPIEPIDSTDPCGARPSRLMQYMKMNRVSAYDFQVVMKNLVFEKTEAEIVAILKDKSQPLLARCIVRAFLEDFRNGSLGNIETLLNRAIGKPKQEIEIAAEINADVVTETAKVSREQRERRIQELLNRKLTAGTVVATGAIVASVIANEEGEDRKE